MARQSVAIIGGGLAGASAAAALREAGFDGTVRLIGAEPQPPYNRPPLSKAYLRGEVRFEDQLVTPSASTPSTTSSSGWGFGSPPSTPG
jgi:3-phenylpropionate/trans-cinnamate dioxygenase ferredoxin reductase subunit